MSQTITPQRKRRFRLNPGTVLNLVLLLIVAIGLAIYYRPPRAIVPSVDRHATLNEDVISADPVLPIDLQSMENIRFQRGDTAIELAKIDSQWYVVEPFQDEADPQAIETLFHALAGIPIDEEITQSESASQYGLDSPIVTTEFTNASGQQYTLSIAQPDDAVEWYIQTSEADNLFLIRNLSDIPFTVIPHDLVKAQLLEFDPAEVRRITEIVGNEVRTIEAEGNAWYSDSELGRAFTFDVDIFLRDLHALTNSDIAALDVDDAWDEFGLVPQGETMRIELEMNDGTIHTLDVGTQTEDGRRYHVATNGRPHIYTVVEFSALNLSKKLAEATTDVLNVNLDRIAEITVLTLTEDGTEVERAFVRDDDNELIWQSNRRVAFYVSGVLETINGVIALDEAPAESAATYGFYPDPNSLTLQLHMTNRAINTLEIGNTTDDGRHVYVRSNSRPDVYLADADNIRSITTGLDLIRTTLMPFDRDNVAEVEVAVMSGADEQTVQLAHTDGAWTHNGAEVDAATVESLLDELHALQAEDVPEVVSEEEYAFFPADNSVQVAVRTVDGEELIFDMGAAVEEGVGWFSTKSYYVRINDLEEVVFIGERNSDTIRSAAQALLE